jgi:hypothetical protein
MMTFNIKPALRAELPGQLRLDGAQHRPGK